MKKKIIWSIVGVYVALFVALFLFLTFEGMKKLSGIDYMLLEGDDDVVICHYDGDWYCGEIVAGNGCFVKTVFWDDKYIVAQAKGKYSDVYYIIEQLETDTFKVYNGEKIPWTSYHSEPWITEEFKSYHDFNSRLQELKIDTTKMQHYSWKYWVGIY